MSAHEATTKRKKKRAENMCLKPIFESKTAKRQLPSTSGFFFFLFSFLLSMAGASNSGLGRWKSYSISPAKTPITWETRVDVCQRLFCIIRKARRVDFGSLCRTRPARANSSSLFLFPSPYIMLVHNFIRRKSTCVNDGWLSVEMASEDHSPMDTAERCLALALLALVNH